MADGLMQTGNPVFDYRARYRARAYYVQRLLMYAGVLTLAAAVILFIESPPMRAAAACCFAAGIFSIVGGAWWGYHWRNRIRREFANEYGVDE